MEKGTSFCYEKTEDEPCPRSSPPPLRMIIMVHISRVYLIYIFLAVHVIAGMNMAMTLRRKRNITINKLGNIMTLTSLLSPLYPIKIVIYKWAKMNIIKRLCYLQSHLITRNHYIRTFYQNCDSYFRWLDCAIMKDMNVVILIDLTFCLDFRHMLNNALIIYLLV